MCYLGKLRPGALEDFGEPEGVSDLLQAIANLQKDYVDPRALDAGDLLWSLSLLHDDLAARLHAGIHGAKLAKAATVTINSTKKAVA